MIHQEKCKDAEKMRGTREKYMKGWGDCWRVVPARLLFPCPLEVLRVLVYPGERMVSEFRVHLRTHYAFTIKQYNTVIQYVDYRVSCLGVNLCI